MLCWWLHFLHVLFVFYAALFLHLLFAFFVFAAVPEFSFALFGAEAADARPSAKKGIPKS